MNSPTRRKNPPEEPAAAKQEACQLKLSRLFAENQETPAGSDEFLLEINTNSADK